ncbi:hypothetical protein BJQ97_01887 [Geobacillus sp. TFV-3]|nr:hypothetical protein BJQ97_01887 [Geobacillus sp. TFV-3]
MINSCPITLKRTWQELFLVFNRKVPWATFCPPPGDENDRLRRVHFH